MFHIEDILQSVSTGFGLLAVYAVLFGIIFAESGLLIGFFLPGDSLLFTSGFLAQKGVFGLNIWILMVGFFIAAVVGDNVGYSFGKRVGKRIFNRESSLLFKKKNLEHANAFYKKHGRKTIIIARFVPVVRTFAPIVAGAGDMHYPTFLMFNVIGGVLWAIGLPLAGYFLGSAIPASEKYLEIVILGIVGISLLPAVWHVLKEKSNRDAIWNYLTKRLLKGKQ